jgi:hypothetical protein
MDPSQEVIRLCVPDKGMTSTVTVERVGEDTFRLLDNDLFNCALTRGTEIQTKPSENAYDLVRVTRRSELLTRRFFLSPKLALRDYEMLGEELVKYGGFWQVDFGGLLTINIPKDFPYDLDRVMADLGIQLGELVDDTA